MQVVVVVEGWGGAEVLEETTKATGKLKEKEGLGGTESGGTARR